MNRLTTKQFLMALFGTAFVGWILGNLLFGSPGLSSEYLAKYKHEHEHYLEVVKSDSYKRYIQRPHLFDMTTAHDPHFEENLRFVEGYEHNPDLAAEEHRIERRSLFFDFFNAGLVVVLIARLAWPALRRFLDDGAKSIAQKIEDLKAAREESQARLREAEAKMAALAQTRDQLQTDTEAALIRELEEQRERHHARCEEVRRENEDQLRDAVNAANRRLRRELFDKALREIEEELREQQLDHARDGLVHVFCAALKDRPA
ncbi:MAG: hypothetical protein RLZZ303_656 [Candidatus Hydrogenedentota bacterium]|jgi:F0F1-type ATP synthase membrane subunit b/b'